jgi:hypothetical protein
MADQEPLLSAPKPGVRFDTIKNTMQTYDLVMFRGSDFVSDVIAAVEQECDGVSDFTHVGVVIRGRDLPQTSEYRNHGEADGLYIFESTASGKLSDGVPSFVDQRGHLGVQLRDLASVVRAYDASPKTRMAWMALRPELRPPRCPAVCHDVIDRYIGRAYAASPLALLGAAAPFMRFFRDFRPYRRARDLFCRCCCCGAKPSTWLFCSELCARIYVDIGVFPDTVNPANVMPADFLPIETTPILNSPTQTLSNQTVDADKETPWVFQQLTRFHS